jgi:hypothetical protein
MTIPDGRTHVTESPENPVRFRALNSWTTRPGSNRHSLRCELIAHNSPPRWQGDACLDFIEKFRAERVISMRFGQ